jgi:hypothetical protein
MSFTYDLSTLQTNSVAQVRLLITDTNSSSYLFEDQELSAFLTLCQNSVVNAAATAYETLARDRAKLMKVTEQPGGYRSEKHASDDFLKLAQALRNSALAGTLQTAEISADNAYLDNFRPQWRRIDSAPVVE